MHTSTMLEPGSNSIPQTEASSSLLVTAVTAVLHQSPQAEELESGQGNRARAAVGYQAARVERQVADLHDLAAQQAFSRSLALTRAVSSARENGLVR